jgi:hypothetical protein
MEIPNETESTTTTTASVNNIEHNFQTDVNLELEKIKNVSLAQIETYLQAEPSTLLTAPFE